MKKDIKELFDEFIFECQYAAKLSHETIRGYKAGFELLTKLCLNLSAGLLSPKLMTDFFMKLETRERTVGKGKKVRGIKKTTIATYWSKLNKFFKWLKMNNHIKQNPLETMSMPKVYYDDRKYLGRQQIEKIFAALNTMPVKNLLIKKRNNAIISLYLYCGLRKSELLGIKVFDVDFQRKQLTVRAETSKSKMQRVIPLNNDAILKLLDYTSERNRKNYKTPYLFVSSQKDEKLTSHGLKHLVGKIVNASGVKFHLHQLRHSFAVNLIHNNSDISKVKQLLGHKDIRMTSSYLRCLPTEEMRGDVERLTLDNLI